MREAEKLRQRAEELLTLAIKAREDGQFDSADSLLAESAKFISDAEAMDEKQARLDQETRDAELAQQLDAATKK